MGVSDRIVGVGTFDRFPPEVSRFPRVGGLLDPNVERILSLKPDLVIVYETQNDLISQLTRAGVPMFRYRHQGLAGYRADDEVAGHAHRSHQGSRRGCGPD